MTAKDVYDPNAGAQVDLTLAWKSPRTIYDGVVGKRYYMRGWDSGTGGYVYWGPYSSPSANLSPSAAQTTPNYTGVLSNPHVYLIRTS